MGYGVSGQTATLLPDGKVLGVAGGLTETRGNNSQDRIVARDPSSKTWTQTGRLRELRPPRSYGDLAA